MYTYINIPIHTERDVCTVPLELPLSCYMSIVVTELLADSRYTVLGQSTPSPGQLFVTWHLITIIGLAPK